MIDTPGIYTLSSAEYHADPCRDISLSSSIAQILLTQSPRHAALAHPRLSLNYQPDEDSRFDLGSAAHALFLEGDGSKIVVVEANDWRTAKAKAERDEARANGLHPVLAKHNFMLTKMVAAAREYIASTELAEVFKTGRPEQTLVWREGEIWCRARLDQLAADHSVIADFKTVESAEPESFIRQISRMQYDVQAAFYMRGLRALGHSAHFVFLAQEITQPHCCSLVALSNAYLEIAERKVQTAIDLWANCIKNDEWPAYQKEILWAEPPTWELARMEAQLKSENW